MSDLMDQTRDQPAAGSESTTAPDISRRSAVSYLFVAAAGIATAGMLMPRRAEAYYGKCYQCNCCGFQGSENTCSNCGHNYNQHSGQTCSRP
jgi:hypothetical protein